MEEKNEGASKDKGEMKPADGDAGKKDGGDGGNAAVYKVDLHCEGCAKKVKRAIKHCDANKVTVVGTFNALKVKERLEEKIRKKIDLVSPQPKKPDDNKKADEKKKDDVKSFDDANINRNSQLTEDHQIYLAGSETDLASVSGGFLVGGVEDISADRAAGCG